MNKSIQGDFQICISVPLRMSCDSICSENGLEFNESERVYSALPIKFLFV